MIRRTDPMILTRNSPLLVGLQVQLLNDARLNDSGVSTRVLNGSLGMELVAVGGIDVQWGHNVLHQVGVFLLIRCHCCPWP